MYKTKYNLRDSNVKTKFNIILDIDETLVHTHDELQHITENQILTDPQFINIKSRIYILKFEDGDNMWGVFRPYAKEFLSFCFSYFDKVIIWSAGTKDYVDLVVKNLFKNLDRPDLVYSKNDCVFVKKDPIYKPLSKIMLAHPELGLTENNTLFLDDRSHTFEKNPNNAIQIPPFDSESNHPKIKRKIVLSKSKILDDDRTLLELIEFFKSDQVLGAKDVRDIDKSQIFTRKLRR